MGKWTPESEREFFAKHRGGLVDAAEKSGAAGVFAFVDAFGDDHERRVLYVFSLRALNVFDWPHRSLDLLVKVADFGLAELRAQADAAEEDEVSARRMMGAHTLSFNLSMDLADCWPGDEIERTRVHLKRGLRAAEDCLSWCPEDRPGLLAQDHWVRGVHRVALGDREGAMESWEASLSQATIHAKDRGLPTEIGKECYFGILLPSGLLGTARMLSGDSDGLQLYIDAMVSLGMQVDNPKMKQAADSAIQQIEIIRAKYLEPYAIDLPLVEDVEGAEEE